MKRNLKTATLVLLFSGMVHFSNAQKNNAAGPFEKGSATASFGAGIGQNYKNSQNSFGTKVALEFGIWPAGPGVISLGIEAGTTFSNSVKGRNDDLRTRTVVVAGRTAWHNGWGVPNLDTYGGLSAGAGFRHSERYDSDDVIPFFGVFIGASYFISPAFGFNIEAGSDITQLQGGIIFKLK